MIFFMVVVSVLFNPGHVVELLTKGFKLSLGLFHGGLLGCLDKNGSDDGSSLHGGQHVSHVDRCGQPARSKTPAHSFKTALDLSWVLSDQSVVDDCLDNVQAHKESVPADIS